MKNIINIGLVAGCGAVIMINAGSASWAFYMVGVMVGGLSFSFFTYPKN